MSQASSQNRHKVYWFAIDPSLHSLGWSLAEQPRPYLSPQPCAAGLIKQLTDTEIPYPTRCMRVASEVARCIDGCSIKHGVNVICETPTNWFNERGESSKDNEAVQKLYWQVGAICSLLSIKPGVTSMHTVTPAWKGQTPKHIMQQRASSWLEPFGLTLPERAPHDVSEAILLAKYAGFQTMANPNWATIPPANWSSMNTLNTLTECETYFDTTTTTD